MKDVRGYFGHVTETGEGWKADCPRCDDTGKRFAWNSEKNVGCCFHSGCVWYHQKGGVTAKRLEYFFSTSGVEHALPDVIEASEEADVALPKEFELIRDLSSHLSEDLYAYLSSRGIKRKVVDKAQLGYCDNGKRWGYIIMPIFDEVGEVVYWQGRRYKNRYPKFYNPASSKKSELVYCVSNTKKPNTVVLVESVMNALTLDSLDKSRTAIVGILGKSMSDAQIDKVMWHEKNLKEIVVALDGDARREAVMIADRFRSLVPSVKIADVPDGEDINSLGKAKAWDLIWNAQQYDSRRRMEFMVGR